MSTTRTAGGTQIEAKDGVAPPGQAEYPRVRTAGEVFVSPRVVDRVAFEDYAQALRKLLAAATSEGEHLRRTALDASRTLRAIGEVLPAVDAKLAKAGEMLGTLTQRLESAEAIAKRAEAAAERAVTAEQRIKDMDDRARSRIFEAGNAAMDEAVARVEEVAEKRAKELDDRGETLTAFVDRGRSDLAEARARAVEALERAAGQAKVEAAAGLEALETQRAQAQRSIAEDHRTATDAIGAARGETVEAIIAERSAAEAMLAERASVLTARVDELVGAAERRLAEKIDSCGTAARDHADAVAERLEREIMPGLEAAAAAGDAAHARASEADAKARGVFDLGLDKIEALCERAEALLEATGAGQAKPARGTLAAVAHEANSAMERMDEVANTGERARRQAEESRKALAESIESAALWLDRLVEQRDGLQQSITLATKLCEQAEGQLAQRRAELDEAMRAPATEVQRHLDALKAVSAEAEHKRAGLAQLIEQTEQKAEAKTTAAAEKAAERAIHKTKLEAEKLDAKAVQARQALEQAWKTLETRLKGELKESLTALSAEGTRAERVRQSLREDIEAARQVEKETRAAISKPAAPSSVEQLNKLATLMQDLADRTASKKPIATSGPKLEAKTESAAPAPTSEPTTKQGTKKTAKRATSKKVAKKTATKKKAGG